jgi:hypothetical protein
MSLGLGCQERRGSVQHLDNPRAGGVPLKHHLRRRSASPWAEPTCRWRTGPFPVARRPYTRLRLYRISADPDVFPAALFAPVVRQVGNRVAHLAARTFETEHTPRWTLSCGAQERPADSVNGSDNEDESEHAISDSHDSCLV